MSIEVIMRWSCCCSNPRKCGPLQKGRVAARCGTGSHKSVTIYTFLGLKVHLSLHPHNRDSISYFQQLILSEPD